MSSVVMQAQVSLDRFIADPSDDIRPLFDWYRHGDAEFTSAPVRRRPATVRHSADDTRCQRASTGGMARCFLAWQPEEAVA
jgi:hypothetical protein